MTAKKSFDDLMGILRPFVDWVTETEPEVLTYAIFRRPKALKELLLIVRYKDRKALKGHLEAPQHTDVVEKLSKALESEITQSTTLWHEVSDSFVNSGMEEVKTRGVTGVVLAFVMIAKNPTESEETNYDEYDSNIRGQDLETYLQRFVQKPHGMSFTKVFAIACGFVWIINLWNMVLIKIVPSFNMRFNAMDTYLAAMLPPAFGLLEAA
ncbi:hypothetical protein KC336_g20519, partial [Hortaea werneckii]